MDVVFVCWGNICRSPLAEHLYRQAVRERGGDPPLTESFGLIAEPGDVPIEDTVRAGRSRGVDVSTHRARRFGTAPIEPRARLLVMEREQRRLLVEQHGIEPARVRLLASFIAGEDEGAEIADPGGGLEAGFLACVDRIDRAVRALAAEEPGGNPAVRRR